MATGPAVSALEEEFQQLLARGGAAVAGGDLERAREALEDALAIRSRDPTVLGLLGQVFYRQARYHDAATAWQQLVDDNPAEPGARINLGLAWLKARRFKAAIQQLRIALDLNPEHRKAAGYLGLAWLEVGRPDQAREWFFKAGSDQMVARCDELLAAEEPHPLDRTAKVVLSEEPPAEEPPAEEPPAEEPPAEEPPAEEPPAEEPPAEEPPAAEQPFMAPEVEELHPLDRTAEVVLAEAPSAEAPSAGAPSAGAPSAEATAVVEPVADEPFAGEPTAEIALAEIPREQPEVAPEAALAPVEPAAGTVDAIEPPGRSPPSEAIRPSEPPGLPTLAGFAAARAVQGTAGQVFVAEGATLTVNVHGELLCRLAGLAAWRGELAFAGEVKRFRGQATDKPFGEPPEQMHRLVGDGLVVLRAAGRRFTVLELDGETGYFREAVVFGFQEQVAFENGRLPSPSGGLDLVHLRGRGRLVLVTRGDPVAVEVTRDSPVHVPLSSLIGWTGALAPRIAPMFAGGAEGEAVEISGEGRVLVDPGPTARHGDGP